MKRAVLLLLFASVCLLKGGDEMRCRRIGLFHDGLQALVGPALEEQPDNVVLQKANESLADIRNQMAGWDNGLGLAADDFKNILRFSQDLHRGLKHNQDIDHRRKRNAFNWLKLIFPNDFRTV